MPLIKIEHLANAVFGVCEATENETFFLNQIPAGYMTGYEPQRFSERRRKEFLASRWLLRQILQDDSVSLAVDENGKLKDTKGNYQFSLSHSGNRVAAIASKTHPVGIDVEEIHPRILKVMHKFLNEQEKQALGENPELWRITLCWSAKESIFKMIETPGLSFSNDIQLSLPSNEAGSFIANVNWNAQWQNVKMCFEKSDGFVLTYCVPTINEGIALLRSQ